MSWQRILEMARRQKMPVVITDIAGREPMVVLPFEEYESLIETGARSVRETADERISVEPIVTPEPSSGPSAGQVSGPRVVGPTTPYTQSQSVAQPSPEIESMAETSLEERFTFEPVP